MEELKTLCPGYFERSVLKLLVEKGPGFRPYHCAVCRQRITPVYKDGGWVPRKHFPHSMTVSKVNET